MRKILFDVDDTLYDMRSPFEKAFRELYQDKYADVDMEKLFVLSRKYSDEVFLATVNGTMSMQDMYVYRIKSSCRDLGIPMSDEEGAQFQTYYAANQKKIEISDTIRKLLEELKSRDAVLGIITNGPSQHQRNKINALGVNQWIPEENMLISGDYDVAKPDPGIFALAVEKLGGTPEEYIFVGDSFENDVTGAKKAGWKSVWVNKRNHKANSEIESDYMVCNEQELYELLTGESK
ncbi:MAG: HAD family hydrolase [Eubacteriales bacterium]|nr:HAD family hydrolase [Eubacteriales bacterium]